MNRNHLAIFHAVAESGSISRGAERLCISQPAVSKQLAEFERAWGMPLFDRLPRALRLTEAGKLLHQYSRRLFALESEAEQAMAELRGLQRGVLRIGASTSIASYLLPSVLVRFHRDYPKIEIVLETGNTAVIQDRVRDGLLEVGFTEGQTPDADDTLEWRVFQEDELIAIAAPGNPINREVGVTIDRLLQEPMLLRESGSGTRAVLESALTRLGRELPRPVLTLAETEAIKRAVLAGAGIAFVSRLAVEEELGTGKLCAIPLLDLTITRPLHQVRRREVHPGKAILAFLALLAKYPASST